VKKANVIIYLFYQRCIACVHAAILFVKHTGSHKDRVTMEKRLIWIYI